MTTACRCDRLIHPRPLRIAAGLDTIPRQTASFPDFRRAMLAAIPGRPALSRWEPGGESDLGEMLLEMWAYVCDSLSFYDEVIAHEEYLRTARRRPSVRRLTRLIGHVPVPAVAAEVELGIVAEGRRPLTLPERTAFRSGAFGEEPPQVFELDAPATVHPLLNKWTLQPPRPDRLGVDATDVLLLRQDTANLEEEDVALLWFTDAASSILDLKVAAVEDHEGDDGGTYARVTFDREMFLGADRSPSTLRLEKGSSTGGLWKGTPSFKPVVSGSIGGFRTATHMASRITGGALAGFAATTGSGGPISTENGRGLITLDGLYRQIKPGDHVILNRGDDRRAFRVIENREAQVKVAEGEDTEITDANGTVVQRVSGQPAYAPVTRLLLDVEVDSRIPPGGASWGSGGGIFNELVMHYGFAPAGVVTVEAKTRIEDGDPLVLQRPVEVPEDGSSPERFLLQDLNENGLATDGAAQLPLRTMSLDSETSLADGLAVPVTVYGNVVKATRGETVADEVLGSGDASRPNQTFTLKKSLTYLSAPATGSDSGVKSTLQVRVDGVLWDEAPSFFGLGPEDQVYVVRQDDEDQSIVTFGDGVRGARLPTGTNNVTATYRHGAGAASPPAGSITQMAKPVKGVTAVANPVPAFGGSDREDADKVRENAPRSALTLGRAVSLADMEALAAKTPGVRAARANWRWHERRQRPVAQVWYVGDSGLESRVSETLRSASDPATPIDVSPSTPIPLHLDVSVQVDRRYVEEDVLAGIKATLLDPDHGLLPPERIGIGAPLFRSQLFQQALSVQGAVAVASIQFRREDPPSLQQSPAYTALLGRATAALEQEQAASEGDPAFVGWSIGAGVGGVVIVTGFVPGPISYGDDVITLPALQPMLEFALSTPEGHHFDVEQGSLVVSGGEAQSG
ncbi:MAG: hypothetical protein ACOC5K_01930 [Chloroflexota bacterium]